MIDIDPIIDTPEPTFDAMQDVFFMLFTRSNPIEGQRIGFDVTSILNSNFNSALPVRILIHGWLGSFTVQENPRTTADFLRRGDYNVIGKFKVKITFFLFNLIKIKFFFKWLIGVLAHKGSTPQHAGEWAMLVW